MEITFKKVQKKHLPLLKELAKLLHLEIEEEKKVRTIKNLLPKF